MLADSHGRSPRRRRGWPALGPRATLLLALALFVGVYALSVLHWRAGAEVALFALPVALLALRLVYERGAHRAQLQRPGEASPELLAQAELDGWITRAGKAWEQVLAERTHELESARAETLQRLALVAEYRDDATWQHTERVGETAARIGERLGLDPGQVALLREAATLHDVGKLAIPDRILLKPGRLTQDEFELMKTHAALGARLLSGSGSPVLQMAAVIAASHHERFDGTGYPAGLAGEAIPLVGRIVAVADVFDALTHERPHRSLWPVEQSLAEIRRAAGTQFDPRVVEAFLEIQADGPPGSLFGERGGPGRSTPGRRRRGSASAAHAAQAARRASPPARA